MPLVLVKGSFRDSDMKISIILTENDLSNQKKSRNGGQSLNKNLRETQQELA